MSQQEYTFQHMHPCGIAQISRKQYKRDNLWELSQEQHRNEVSDYKALCKRADESPASEDFFNDDFECIPFSVNLDSICCLEYDIDNDNNIIEINNVGNNRFTRIIKNLGDKKAH